MILAPAAAAALPRPAGFRGGSAHAHAVRKCARRATGNLFIPARALGEELLAHRRRAACRRDPETLEEEKLCSSLFAGARRWKLNLQGLARLEKSLRLVAEGNGLRAERLGPFLYVLTERLNPKEKAALIKATDLHKPELDHLAETRIRARKLEGALKAVRIKKPSQVYQIVSRAAGDEVVFLLYHSQNKLVQERIRNYIQKYMPLAQEFPATALQAIEAKPGTPKFEKARDALLAAHLDRRPRKPPVSPPPPMVETIGLRGRARP